MARAKKLNLKDSKFNKDFEEKDRERINALVKESVEALQECKLYGIDNGLRVLDDKSRDFGVYVIEMGLWFPNGFSPKNLKGIEGTAWAIHLDVNTQKWKFTEKPGIEDPHSGMVLLISRPFSLRTFLRAVVKEMRASPIGIRKTSTKFSTEFYEFKDGEWRKT